MVAISAALGVCSPSAILYAQQRAETCPASVSAVNDYGLLRIKVVSNCRRGENFRVVNGTWEREVRFSEDGVAQLAVPLVETRGQVLLSYQDGAWSEVSAATVALSTNAYRITLQWELPVDLNLHVVEPGGTVGGNGDAAAKTAGNARTLGRIDLEDDGKGVSPFLESYVITSPTQARELYSVHIENVTRGWVPTGDHCRGGQYAQVPVTVIFWDRGQVSQRNLRLPVPSCNVRLSPAEYFLKPIH